VTIVLGVGVLAIVAVLVGISSELARIAKALEERKP
jgi:hypothetical protein